MLAPAISNKFCDFVKLCLALLIRFVTKIRLGSYSNRRETRDHLDSLSLAFNTNKLLSRHNCLPACKAKVMFSVTRNESEVQTEGRDIVHSKNFGVRKCDESLDCEKKDNVLNDIRLEWVDRPEHVALDNQRFLSRCAS